MTDKKLLLCILDGWGIGPNPADSAIKQGNTPFMDSLNKKYPNARLNTFGLHVGLPEGQMGNSEVGHMNIGAGRIVYQDLVRINLDIKHNALQHKEAIKEGIAHAKNNNSSVHLLGLVSAGGVHSHIDHLLALCDILAENNVSHSYIHAFTDGRDTDPKSGRAYLEKLCQHIQKYPNVNLASLIGRYYAMDRDQRWDRIKIAYDLLVKGRGKASTNIVQSLQESYDKGITDEFIEPIFMEDQNGEAIGKIKNGDVVFFFNFRSDRPRELTRVLSQEDRPESGMKKLNLHYITMTPYDEAFKNIHLVYTKENLKDTLGEILSAKGKSQLRIAETEKYAHVTFFFSGGKEEPFEFEKRRMIPSPKVTTYDLKPEMSAVEVTDVAIDEMLHNQPDFICLNYANSDMVGHTGDFKAATIAVETVDSCLERLSKQALELDYDLIIIADHGNADVMRNPDGSANTAHSLSPVPIIWLGNNTQDYSLKDGKLADIAPTILHIMQIAQPELMTGKNLIVRRTEDSGLQQ